LSPGEKERLLSSLRELLGKRDEVLFAVVFGGFLEDRPFRDVDVGVYLAYGRAAEDIVEAALYAEELGVELSEALGLPVDVVVLNHVPAKLLLRALRGRVLVDKDPIKRARLYLMALDLSDFPRWYRQRP